MFRNLFISTIAFLVFLVFAATESSAFWLWTPKEKTVVNPKYAVKDSPQEQWDWAMRLYKENDFKRAAEEFERLCNNYRDSELAPEAQYYAARSYEEQGKYLFAFENYQKTVENYPYTRRMDEILQRQFNIANIFENKDTAKIMDLELSLSMDRAAEMYGKIVDNSPFGRYAEKSLFRQADVYRRMKKYDLAAGAYERIINDYPDSTLVDEAKYQLAYTRYAASLDPEYDQEGTDEALREFKQISKGTPVPSIQKEAEKAMSELKNRKAASTMRVAQFYEKQHKYKSAVMYYELIVTKFPESDSAKPAEEKINVLKKRIKD